MLAEVGAGVDGRQGRERLGEREEEASVDEGGDVGDEDLLGYGPPDVAEGFEDATGLGGLVSLMGFGASGGKQTRYVSTLWQAAYNTFASAMLIAAPKKPCGRPMCWANVSHAP